ncbi:MAG TPA: PAS domain-containing protein [Thermoanaerobaculia bacterium]|nr:PAS domain-containing protein [Thermoanaerobaculia bacterium]
MTDSSDLNKPRETRAAQSEAFLADRFRLLRRELDARALQQTAVAELGQAALTLVDCSLLVAQACALVADTLQTDSCRVMEYLPGEKKLITLALVGQRQDGPSVEERTDSEAMFTLLSNRPVLFFDLAHETRFDGTPLLNSMGVASGMSVTLPGRKRPFGILGTYSTKQREFAQYEVEFVQSIANVLAAAIESRRTHLALEESRAEVAHREKLGRIGSWTWSRGNQEWQWSHETFELLGLVPGSVPTDYASFLARVHPADRAAFVTMMERASRDRDDQSLEHRIVTPDGVTRVVKSVVQGIFNSDLKALRIIGTTRDVSVVAHAHQEQIRLSALIEMAAREWRMACDAIETVIVVTDREGLILRLNEKARELLGITFEQALGRPLPAPSLGEPWATIREIVAVVSETQVSASALCRNDAIGSSWEISARALSHEQVSDERIVVVAQNTTLQEHREQVRREGDLLEASIHLIHGISRRVRPAVLLLDRLLPAGDAGSRPLEEMAARTTLDEITALFDDLDEYARPFRADSTPGLLHHVIHDAMARVAPIAHARNILIDASLDRELPPVIMNRGRLERLFTDLLLTFVQRAPAGVVRLQLSEAGWYSEPWLNVMIESSAKIFEPEELPCLLDTSTIHMHARSGLTLAVDQRIAEEHGAVMTAANRVTEPGSFVSVKFPPLR